MDCVFCSIIEGTAPATIVGETDRAIAFRDINPAAPVHVLLVPRRHIVSAADLTAADGAMLGELLELGATVAKAEGVGDAFRLVSNSGYGGGQRVFHLHFHLLGGWHRGPRQLATETGGMGV